MARAKRGTFSAPMIREAALALLDQQGLHALTMRGLASHLGAEPMSIYAHIRSKGELLMTIKDDLFAQIREEPPDAAWDAKLRTVMLSTHEIAMRHPCFVPLWIGSPRTAGSQARKAADLATLVAAGYPEDEALFSLDLLIGHVVGYSLHGFDGAALRNPRTRERSFERPSTGPHHDELFVFGLDTVLDGLRQRHVRLTGEPGADGIPRRGTPPARHEPRPSRTTRARKAPARDAGRR